MTDYTTKDSGARQQFDSGMQRDTEAGKPRFDLLIPEDVPYEEQLLTRFASLLARGAEKYTERNWEQADSMAEVNRARSSAFRHFMQWFCGETDEDHAVATLFNIMVVETVKPRVEAKDETNYDAIADMILGNDRDPLVVWRDSEPMTLKMTGVALETIALATGVPVEELRKETSPTFVDSNTLEEEDGEVELVAWGSDDARIHPQIVNHIHIEDGSGSAPGASDALNKVFNRGGYMPRVEDLRM